MQRPDQSIAGLGQDVYRADRHAQRRGVEINGRY